MVSSHALEMHMGKIKKYTTLISIGFSKMLAWRFAFLMITVGAVVSWLVMIIFWRAVYAAGNQIGSFTLEQLVLYYTANTIILIVMNYSFVWDVSNDLHEGRLSEYLLKPISYVVLRFLREFGTRAASLVAVAIPLIGVLYYFRNMIPSSPSTWILFCVTLFFGYIVTALFGFTISLNSIFLQNSHTAPSIFLL